MVTYQKALQSDQQKHENRPNTSQITSLYFLPHMISILQLRPEDCRWCSLPGFSHVLPGDPLCQQRHDHLSLPVRWLQLCTGEPSTSLPHQFERLISVYGPDPPPSCALPSPQGPFVFFFRIVFNKEARNAMKYCCSRKRPDHMIKSKASVSPSPNTLTKYSIQSDTSGMFWSRELFLKTADTSHL